MKNHLKRSWDIVNSKITLKYKPTIPSHSKSQEDDGTQDIQKTTLLI